MMEVDFSIHFRMNNVGKIRRKIVKTVHELLDK